MASMREKVQERIAQLETTHQRMKTRRFGFLVRPAILTIGTFVLIAGIIMIPLPGQGWLTTFLGIGILSLEARWARSVLSWSLGAYENFSRWYAEQSSGTRWALMAGLGVVTVVTFFVIAWGFWYFGAFDWGDHFFADLLGWSRRG